MLFSLFHGNSIDHLFETGSKDLNLQKPTLLLQRIKSGLNICRPRVWTNIYVGKNCLISLEQVCNFPIFPKGPDKRSLVKNVYISLSASEVDGLQLLGFLQQNVTGEYLFPVTSNVFCRGLVKFKPLLEKRTENWIHQTYKYNCNGFWNSGSQTSH